MALERYLAIAGLALSVFFVAEIITLFNFMINPSDTVEFGFEAAPKIFQFISLSIAPATIVFGVSFVLSKRYGSKLNGALMIIGGIVILIGMIFSYTMIDDIEDKLIDTSVEITPVIFMIVSIPIIIFGTRLLKIKPRKPKKNYLEDDGF
ncbi:MAG: hypothetical protein QF559_02660 [Candidatus Nitrosopelagicus sp.]|jgi:hypothetical protein|nr:hypothetical protein [Candidatus Nitrosopelagicus sp.]